MLKQDYYNDFFDFGQQKINFSFFELSLPDDDPVYTLKKVMEELDFSGLLACYSNKGRTGFNPIMLYAVVTYVNMRGVRAVDRIVDLCQRDLAFIRLTKGQKKILLQTSRSLISLNGDMDFKMSHIFPFI